jgi:hypothetical protein
LANVVCRQVSKQEAAVAIADSSCLSVSSSNVFRVDSPVTWSAANCQKFLDQAVKLWDGWQ